MKTHRLSTKIMQIGCCAIFCLISTMNVAAFDGNEFADLAVGVQCEDFSGFENSGIFHILYSSSEGLTSNNNVYFSQDSTGIEDECEYDDQFANALASGDFNGDEYADLAIGIKWEDIGSEQNAGAVAIIYGSAEGLSESAHSDQFLTLDYLDVADVSQGGDLLGNSLACGDFNGDGFDDLAIGDSNQNVSSNPSSGSVYVVYGSSLGLDPNEAQEWCQDSQGIEGTGEEMDEFGYTVASGDINGDGFDDLVVGADGEAIGSVTAAGCIHLIYGSGSGLTSAGNQIIWQGLEGFSGTAEEGDRYGSALAVGDFNGDGFGDVSVGSPFETFEGPPSVINTGAFSVMYGSSGGIVTEGNSIFYRINPGEGELLGKSLAAGDFDSDGYADLAIGAPGTAIDSLPDCGNLTIIYGSESGLSISRMDTYHQGDGVISDTAEAFDIFAEVMVSGDLNGDGFDDLVVGVPWEDLDPDIDDAGAVHAVFGSASGLTTSGEQFWNQDSTDIGGAAELEDQFGTCLAISAIPRKSSACTNTGTTLWMPAHTFTPGHPCSCKVTVCNAEPSQLDHYPLFVILEVAGTYYFAPSFSDYDNYDDQYGSFPVGNTEVTVISEFSWPDGVGSYDGCMWYSALTDPGVTQLFGNMDSFYFGWSE